MPLLCSLCPKLFSSQSTLNRHIRTVHRESSHNLVTNIAHNAKCMECPSTFTSSDNLREHLSQCHDFHIEKEKLTFKSFADFESWLHSLYTEENVQYVRHQGKKRCQNGALLYWYNCNRSLVSRGSYVVKDAADRKRKEKRQGSCKLNFRCTSQIRVLETSNNVSITYYKTHYGHDLEAEHLRLHKEDKKDIANKLISGLPESRILEEIESNSDGHDKIGRLHRLTHADIKNIKMEYGIDSKCDDDESKKIKAENVLKIKRLHVLPNNDTNNEIVPDIVHSCDGERRKNNAAKDKLIEKINHVAKDVIAKSTDKIKKSVLQECYEYLTKAKLILDMQLDENLLKETLEPHDNKLKKQTLFSTKNMSESTIFIKCEDEESCIVDVVPHYDHSYI